jgi:hypothetical protein
MKSTALRHALCGLLAGGLIAAAVAYLLMRQQTQEAAVSQVMRFGLGNMAAEFGPGFQKPVQPRLKAGQPVDGALGVGARNNRFEGGMPAPQVGTAQCANTGDFHQAFILAKSTLAIADGCP